MNPNQMTHPSPQWLAAMAARGYAFTGKQANRATAGGFWLLLIGVMVTLSGVAFFRVPVFNLHVQPYLIPVAMAPVFVLGRLPKLPLKVLLSFLVFWALYAIALIGPSVQRVTPMEESLKLLSSVGVIIIVALLVASRADFVLGSMGLTLAIGMLAFRGLEEEQAGVIDAAVANKNSYSLYALPAVLLAIYIALRLDWKKVSFRRLAVPVMLMCALASAVAIVAGANRSGYLGLAFIVLMVGFYLVFSPRLRLGRKSQGVILLTCLVVAVVAGLAYKGAQEFQYRYYQTVHGTESDQLRVDLFLTSVRIGIEHPVRGVSPQVLPVMLAQRLLPDFNPGRGIESHNVFAHIIGGCGLVELAVLLYLAGTLFFWRPGKIRSLDGNADFHEARTLLRMMLLLWAVRGMFSQEILFNPGFCVGLGLVIGLCMVEFDLIKKSAYAGYASMGQMIPPYARRAR